MFFYKPHHIFTNVFDEYFYGVIIYQK